MAIAAEGCGRGLRTCCCCGRGAGVGGWACCAGAGSEGGSTEDGSTGGADRGLEMPGPTRRLAEGALYDTVRAGGTRRERPRRHRAHCVAACCFVRAMDDWNASIAVLSLARPLLRLVRRPADPHRRHSQLPRAPRQTVPVWSSTWPVSCAPSERRRSARGCASPRMNIWRVVHGSAGRETLAPDAQSSAAICPSKPPNTGARLLVREATRRPHLARSPTRGHGFRLLIVPASCVQNQRARGERPSETNVNESSATAAGVACRPPGEDGGGLMAGARRLGTDRPSAAREQQVRVAGVL